MLLAAQVSSVPFSAARREEQMALSARAPGFVGQLHRSINDSPALKSVRQGHSAGNGVQRCSV